METNVYAHLVKYYIKKSNMVVAYLVKSVTALNVDLQHKIIVNHVCLLLYFTLIIEDVFGHLLIYNNAQEAKV